MTQQTTIRMRTTLINTATTKKAVLSLAVLVSFCLVFGVACGSNAQAPSGALPTWNVGDTWTMKGPFIHGGNDSLFFVITVTGEQVFNGIDCYTLNTTCNMGEALSTETSQIDKTTLDPIGINYSISVNGSAWTKTEALSYNYSIKPYPFSVGKTWTRAINISSTTVNFSGQTSTTTETQNVNFKVEKVESLTVPAGTFQCFKIVEYDENNSVISTAWFTDVAGGWIVKEIDSAGTTSELMSYSLSK
jgi:hypothetical protein